ncbi:hypothetical protein SODALDRAFT_353392 [Sodiomyces alkalinus F11]|uniref:Uncharacterized protein n=1 Tax=Sodiomyces alkalinus (strain CBS 110278 / VKM F-3762 / F11) TaxID=1314773 RepID=A0A3N2PKL0_SODAK|nr:hypothetical protein SODALDRAFT_353392 [Sodiomyces alkalinus F11]ROT34950.1 hypothetical protein SODALDRAFT_353392 [Sodiomyces alkalinus F11]
MSRYNYDRDPVEEPPRGRGHMPRHASPYPRGPLPDDDDDSSIYPSSPHHNPDRLQAPPTSNRRPRSLPPEHDVVSRDLQLRHRPSPLPPAVPDPPSIDRHHAKSPSPRSRSRVRRPSRSKSTTRGPIDKARDAADRTFSQTPSGLGVGLLGAVVGGLAAREVNDTARARRHRTASSPPPPRRRSPYSPRSPYSSSSGSSPVRHRHPGRGGNHHRNDDEDERTSRLVSTVVGALVGGLGANALERRFENARERHRAQQGAWERKWGPTDRLNDRHHHHGRRPSPPPPHYHRPDKSRAPRGPPSAYEEPERGSRYARPRVVVDTLDDGNLAYDGPPRRGRS